MEKSVIIAKFQRKLSKQLGDWSSCLCSTTDTENLPPQIRMEKGGVSVVITGNNLPELQDCAVKYYGTWVTNKYGTQMKCDSYEILLPTEQKGLVSFLSSSAFQGIGKKTAESIVEEFGDDTINIIENNPNMLLRIPGITVAKLGTLVVNYDKIRSYSRLSVFLAGFGVGANTINKIAKKYGKNAVKVISENPYRIQEVSGVGFKTSDKIARGLNVALNSYKRIEGGILETIKTMCNRTGDLYVEYFDLQKNTLKLLNEGLDNPVDEKLFVNAFTQMKENQLLVPMRLNVATEEGAKTIGAVFQKSSWDAEYNSCQKLLWLQEKPIGEHIVEAVKTSLKEYCKTLTISPSEKQKAAVIKSLSNRVSIITGGPGTGKTTIISAILHCYREVFKDKITLMAPTGKAARRMSESTGCEASTIHSKLAIYGEDGTIHDPEPIYDGLIVVDETSMVDQFLLEQLLSAIQTQDIHLIFVGDVDQLASVGAGAVLSEMINSEKIATTRLTEIFRQKNGGGGIVDNAIKINYGYKNIVYDDNQFVFIETKGEDEAMSAILKTYEEEVARVGIDNVALLSPLRKTQGRFTCVADNLNGLIQDKINVGGNGKPFCKIFNKEFRLGDRVMQWQNTKTSSNGDVGEIVKIYEDQEYGLTLDIMWDNGTLVNAHREDMETIELAYAISVHKSQGSEYDTVIIPMISEQLCQLFKRNLLYTGVTRAKKKVIIIGDKEAVNYCIDHSDNNKRKTLLSMRLQYNS